MEYYAIVGNEIAISHNRELLEKYYTNIQELPSDYYEHIYAVIDGELVIDTEAEKKAKIMQLDAEYTRQKTLLIEQYTDDTLHDDQEAMAADKEEMATLDAWYDEEYQKLESEAE